MLGGAARAGVLLVCWNSWNEGYEAYYVDQRSYDPLMHNRHAMHDAIRNDELTRYYFGFSGIRPDGNGSRSRLLASVVSDLCRPRMKPS